jgi:hypothetical protein
MVCNNEPLVGRFGLKLFNVLWTRLPVSFNAYLFDPLLLCK